MKRKRSIKKTVILSLMGIFISLFIFFSVVPIIIINPVIRRVEFSEMWEAKDFGITSNKITVLTDDGLNVVAYEVSADNPRGVIIFIPGIRGPSITAGFGHARLMKENGFSSILLERRARGESEGNVIGLGYMEYLDVKAVVEHIRTQDKEVPIIVYGWSMGAATALIAIGEIPDIAGAISLAAFSSLEDIFEDVLIDNRVPRFIAVMQRPFVSAYATIRYGTKTFRLSPKAAMHKLGDRPVLIVHSKMDSVVPFRSFNEIMDNAPAHVESWILEGDRHLILETMEDILNPENDQEYVTHIMGFLDRNW